MIKILDLNYNRLAIIKNVNSSKITNEINGEYKFDFECILDEKTSNFVNENNLVEIEEDYFDIITYTKKQNEDGTLAMSVQCEHISYRLNNPEYNLETFARTGTPAQILTYLLAGTEFTNGTIQYTDNVTYSAQEAKSRRQLLMEFVAYIGAEVDFDKLQVSLLTHIGSTDLKILAKSKNIKVVSKTYNARETNELGQPLISYTVTPIQLPNLILNLGDEILLIQKELDIQEEMRIVKYSYNPYEKMEAEIELANFTATFEDQIYRIETKQVTKEKIYNGCKIGPEEGFVSERSDGKAKTITNSTEGISIYSDTGSGLTRNFFVDVNGRIQGKSLDIDGNSILHGEVDITNGDVNVNIAPTGGDPFKISYDGDIIFKVDSSGNGEFSGKLTSDDVIIDNGSSTGSLNFKLDNSYMVIKSSYTTGGNSLLIGYAISPGDILYNLERVDILAGTLYVYNNLSVASNITMSGNTVATQSWVGSNYSPLGHTHSYATTSYVNQALLNHLSDFHGI